MTSGTLPKRAWVVLVRDKVVLTDDRLPVFWIRSAAETYVSARLGGIGRIVRVAVAVE